MSKECEIAETAAPMGLFERYLTLWVALCIVAGVGLGHVMPGPFHAIGRMEVAQVNLPVAVLIWLMIIPMLLKIDFGALHQVKEHWKGIGVTLFINWAVKPFSMALLGWVFVSTLFRPYLPADQIDSYIAGLILLAVAAAISLFGFQSGAALATVVGVLIEVPVMLSVVRMVNASKDWYEGKGLRRGGSR